MKVGDICRRPVVTVTGDDSIVTAARQMREKHVGDVVVTSAKNGVELPVGILTDRDIVVSLAAKNVDLDSVSVGEVMSPGLIVAREDDDLHEVLSNMKNNGVRRIPIIDRNDRLVGILSIDDLLHHFAGELGLLSRVVDTEIARERHKRV